MSFIKSIKAHPFPLYVLGALILAGVFIFWRVHVDKPPIVDFFACGDYCPEPQETYMVKVYQGVTDEKICKKLGGTFSSFVGWGITYYCLATTPR